MEALYSGGLQQGSPVGDRSEGDAGTRRRQVEWGLVSECFLESTEQMSKRRRETVWQGRERAAPLRYNGSGDSRNKEDGWLEAKLGLQHCLANPFLMGRHPPRFPQGLAGLPTLSLLPA